MSNCRDCLPFGRKNILEVKQEKSQKKETRLCGHAVCGGCSLSALNKQEAGRCVQKADGIDGLADWAGRKCKFLLSN